MATLTNPGVSTSIESGALTFSAAMQSVPNISPVRAVVPSINELSAVSPSTLPMDVIGMKHNISTRVRQISLAAAKTSGTNGVGFWG